MIPVISKTKNKYNFSPRNVPGLQLWLSADRGVQAGNAAQFTVANVEYLSIADNASLSAGDVAVHMGAFVYIDSLPGVGIQATVIGKWAGNGEYALLLDNTGGTIRFKFYVRDTADTAYTIATETTLGTPSVSTWYFVEAYHDPDANLVGIAVNNAAFVTQATSGGVRDSTGAFQIGAYGSSSTWNGRICNVFFRKQVPTAAERTWLYNGGTPRKYNELGVSGNDGSNLLANLISYWELEEDSGNRADKHGTNTLTDNATVTGNSGPALLPAVDGDPVRQWKDISINANHATQATGVSKPIYKTNIQNGRPVVRFDGSNDRMLTGTFSPTIAQPYSIVCIYKIAAIAASQVVYDGSGTRQYLFKDSGATGGLYYGAPTQVTGEVPHTHGSYEISIATMNSTSGAFWINGVAKGTGDTGTAAYTRGILADNGDPGSGPLNGDITEYLLYQGALSSAQRNSINRYFSRKYSVGVV